MDVVARFLEECTENSFAGMVRASNLYRIYTQWCDTNGEYKLSNTKFGKEIAAKYEKVKQRDGLYYSGIVLNPQYTGISITKE